MAGKSFKVLAINPGSTSTKLALYDGKSLVFKSNIEHSREELAKNTTPLLQVSFRMQCIFLELDRNGVDTRTFDAAVGRGGMLKGLLTGAYQVDHAMAQELLYDPLDVHASNLGGVLAYEVARPLGIPAYIYDSVMSDQMDEIAKLTGLPSVQRGSACHVLNSRAAGHRMANELGKRYDECCFVVTHMGGGVSTSLHKKGRIADVFSDDEGAYAPERCGPMPARAMSALAVRIGDEADVLKLLRGNSGLIAHLGTSDVREVVEMIQSGDEHAKLVLDGMIYQIIKSIGAMSAACSGDIDAILLTGGIAYSDYITDTIKNSVKFIAPVKVFAGENELESLSFGIMRVLSGEEAVNERIIDYSCKTKNLF